jgi:integrative and conjugative element protein (TIGR02256 family)
MKAPTTVVWLPRKLHDQMRRLAAHACPNETGGALVGFDAGNGLVIEAVIGPGLRAVHELHAFVPDYDYQDAEIARIYARSGRCHAYLGDWHSHPGGSGELSRQDKRTLRAIASHPAARMHSPVMAVLAGGDSWRLTIWRYVPRDVQRGCFFSRCSEMQIFER